MAKSTPPVGLEPTTARLRAARSTDWARKATNETNLTTLFYHYYNYINKHNNQSNKQTYQDISIYTYKTWHDFDTLMKTFDFDTCCLYTYYDRSPLYSYTFFTFFDFYICLLFFMNFYTAPLLFLYRPLCLFLRPFSLPWYTFSFYIC